MARVVVSATASRDLDRIIRVLSLPEDTRARVKKTLQALEHFPLLGGQLEGHWKPLRFLLGPWRWMIIVYHYDETLDRVGVVAFHDARSALSPLPR